MTLLKNLHYMLHLMKRVYVEPEEENYKRIVCKGKIQQWNQFQQIKRRCVLGMEPKLQRNIQLLLCRGGHFNVTPHPMERLFLKINIILKKTKEKKKTRVGGEWSTRSTYEELFTIKCFIWKVWFLTTGICFSVLIIVLNSGTETSVIRMEETFSILFLQKVELGIRSGSQLCYKQPSQRTLGSVTRAINGNLMLPCITHLHFSTTDRLVSSILKMMKIIPTSYKLPNLALSRASRSIGN